MSNKKANEKRKSVCTLISGGLDSATLVAWAQENGYQQHAFFVNYGQDNLDKELECARFACERVGVSLEVVDASGLRNSFLGRFPRPLNLYDCGVQNPVSYVTTYSLTTLVAGLTMISGRETLLIGVHRTDIDAWPTILQSMHNIENTVSNIILKGSQYESKFHLELPFKDLPRPEVIRIGMKIGINYEKTWSCHEVGTVPCGRCIGCQERELAFKEANLKDPILTSPSIEKKWIPTTHRSK